MTTFFRRLGGHGPRKRGATARLLSSNARRLDTGRSQRRKETHPRCPGCNDLMNCDCFTHGPWCEACHGLWCPDCEEASRAKELNDAGER